MIYLKQFENFKVPLFGLPNLKDEIDEILLDIRDDFPELEWEISKENAFYWKFHTTKNIHGIMKSRRLYKKVSNYLNEIKGRLSDLNIQSEYSLRKKPYSPHEIDNDDNRIIPGINNFEIVLLLRQKS